MFGDVLGGDVMKSGTSEAGCLPVEILIRLKVGLLGREYGSQLVHGAQFSSLSS